MIDVETNQILGLEVTDEAVQDDRMFVPLLDQVQQHCDGGHPVHRVLGDGAYDRNELSMPSRTARSSPASGPGRMQWPTHPGHPIGLSTSLKTPPLSFYSPSSRPPLSKPGAVGQEFLPPFPSMPGSPPRL